MRKLLIVFSSLAVAACSHTQPGIEIREVLVPTPVPCVAIEDVPGMTPLTPLTGNARTDAALLAAENLDLRAEAGDLRALIVPGCIRTDFLPEGIEGQ